MSFSLPLQALGTFQLIIRIPGNGATMRPSFELKSLPASKLLRGVSCNTLTSSSIHFEVVEEGDGSGLTLAVSKEPEQIHWESIPGTPSAQHQVLHNYLETDNTMFNQDSRHVSLMGSENIALEKDSSDAGNFDMASFMLPTPPRECAPGTVADMSIFGTQHPSSFADSLIPQLSHPADMCGSDVYASSSGSPQSPPSLELPTSVRPDVTITPSPCASSRSPSPNAASGIAPAPCQDADVEIDDMSTSAQSSSSAGPRRRPRNFPCQKPNCNRVFTSSYTRDAHMLTHRPKTKKSYECTVGCGAFFSRQHDRWRHEVTQHGKPSQWTCTRCSQYFSSQRGLETHKTMCSTPLSLAPDARNESSNS